MSNPHVIDITEANFQAEVITRSNTHPVLVDLWAEWCGPCKTLSPILEQLAADGGGQWTLAKIDVDAQPLVAEQFQAKSIPFVVAVFQGQIVHTFAGAQPRGHVLKWIEAIFKAVGLTLAPPEGEVPVPTEPLAAIAYWSEKVAKGPDNQKARLELGRLMLAHGQADEADTLLNAIPGSAPEFGAARAALALKTFVDEVHAAGGEAAILARVEAGEADGELTYLHGLIHGASGRFAAALDLLVGLVGTTKDPLKGRAHKASSLILEAAGRADEAVEKQRKRLTRLLF